MTLLTFNVCHVNACLKQFCFKRVLPATSVMESVPSSAVPTTSASLVMSCTPASSDVSEMITMASKPDIDVQDGAGDLHSNLLRTITQLMQQQQKQPPQNQV